MSYFDHELFRLSVISTMSYFDLNLAQKCVECCKVRYRRVVGGRVGSYMMKIVLTQHYFFVCLFVGRAQLLSGMILYPEGGGANNF